MDKGTLTYIKGDALEKQHTTKKQTYIIHCCNNKRAWGAGFSGAISKKWPGPEEKYRNLEFAKLGQYTMSTVEQSMWVVNIIAQDGYGRDGKKYIKYWALKAVINNIILLIKRQIGPKNNVVIQCPRIGCELAGGRWEKVLSILAQFTESGIDVIICDKE